MKRPPSGLYLASTSPRRKWLLRRMGLRFRAVASDYRERKIPGVSVRTLVMRHAMGKAIAAVPRVKNGVILGADTVVYFRGKVIGKPRHLADAVRTLSALSGKWHTVYTGVALLRVREGKVDRKKVYCERTLVRLRCMDRDTILRYFKRIDPLDKAGSYAIQSRRAGIVESVKGSFSNAVGLPCGSLTRRLRPFLS